MCFFSQKLLVNFKKRKEKKEMANTKFNVKSSSIKTAFFLVKSTLNLYLQLLIFFFNYNIRLEFESNDTVLIFVGSVPFV